METTQNLLYELLNKSSVNEGEAYFILVSLFDITFANEWMGRPRNRQSCQPHQIIDSSLTWDKQKEGHDYWYEKDKELKRKIKDFLSPSLKVSPWINMFGSLTGKTYIPKSEAMATTLSKAIPQPSQPNYEQSLVEKKKKEKQIKAANDEVHKLAMELATKAKAKLAREIALLQKDSIVTEEIDND